MNISKFGGWFKAANDIGTKGFLMDMVRMTIMCKWKMSVSSVPEVGKQPNWAEVRYLNVFQAYATKNEKFWFRIVAGKKDHMEIIVINQSGQIITRPGQAWVHILPMHYHTKASKEARIELARKKALIRKQNKR